MKITSFAKWISIHEKGTTQVSIAQIMEILKLVNQRTKGILYKVIAALSLLILLGPLRPAHALQIGDQLKLSLLDHAMIATQVDEHGDIQTALVDSVILIGRHNGYSILDIQGGIFGNARPETVDEAGIKWAAQAFLKIHPFTRDNLRLADQYKFLNSLNYGLVGGYNITDEDWYGRLQFALEFGADPKQ